MFKLSWIALQSSFCLLLVGTGSGALAQQTEDTLSTALELGVFVTGGNTRGKHQL
ncbi:MAG: hypothetical protein RL572_1944 [Pseudomonadota bacterium]|jgi:hypothetical protein